MKEASSREKIWQRGRHHVFGRPCPQKPCCLWGWGERGRGHGEMTDPWKVAATPLPGGSAERGRKEGKRIVMKWRRVGRG